TLFCACDPVGQVGGFPSGLASIRHRQVIPAIFGALAITLPRNVNLPFPRRPRIISLKILVRRFVADAVQINPGYIVFPDSRSLDAVWMRETRASAGDTAGRRAFPAATGIVSHTDSSANTAGPSAGRLWWRCGTTYF